MIIIFMLLILFGVVLLLKNETYFNGYNYDAFTNNNNNNNSRNVVLIGDSMLNNSNYVYQGESVPDLLSKKLVGNATVYNFAKDGATIADCYSQLDKTFVDLNSAKTTIFVSCGGNNILNSRQTEKIDVTNLFAEYSELIKSIKSRVPNADLYVLNLYMPANGHYTSYKATIDQWNQLINDNASVLGYSVLKTDDLLVAEEDFVYGVEPSLKGGTKLASKLFDHTL
jgi:hypothetical protein